MNTFTEHLFCIGIVLSLWVLPCPIGLSVVLRNVAKPAIYPNTTPTRELYVSK